MPIPFRFLLVLPTILALSISGYAQIEPTSSVAEARTQVVAVLPFSTIGHDSTAGIILSDAIAMEILRTRKARVLERSQIKTILDEQGLQQSGLCDAQECAIQVGRILGVQRIVVGSVGRLGNTNTMTLRLVDVGSSEIVAFASERTEGRLESLLKDAVRHSVESLFPLMQTAPTTMASTVAASTSAKVDSSLPASAAPPSAAPILRAIRPGAFDLSIQSWIPGNGSRLYEGFGTSFQARGWWTFPPAPWIAAAGGIWHVRGVDYDGFSGRVSTTGTGYGATLRAHVGTETPVDIYGQYEFQHGYFMKVEGSEESVAWWETESFSNRWVTLHTLGTGMRWKTPIPRLDLLGGYSFGLLGHDPLHRLDASLLWNWTSR